MSQNQNNRQKGFTLIEIIAVLVILGILAAVAVPKFVNLQEEARKKAASNLIASIQSALSMKYAEELLKNNGDTNASWNAIVSSVSNCENLISKDGYTDYTITCQDGTNIINITVTLPNKTTTVTGNFTNPNP